MKQFRHLQKRPLGSVETGTATESGNGTCNYVLQRNTGHFQNSFQSARNAQSNDFRVRHFVVSIFCFVKRKQS